MAIAPFLFILVDVLCEFAMVPGVYILLSPQKEEVHYSSWGQRCTHSAAHSSKRFKPLSDMIWLWQGYWWIWKNTNKEFSCVMVFIMRPSNTFTFFLVSMNVPEQFFPYTIEFEKISGFIFGLWLYDFWFYDTNDSESFLTPCWWKKTWVQRPLNIFQNVEKDL